MNALKQTGHSILALALLAGAAASLPAQTLNPNTSLSQAVHFEIGDTYFLDGDSITIDSIKGVTDTIAPGNLYLVTGTYKLASHPSAVLSSNVTTKGPSGPTSNHDAPTEPRNVSVSQGEDHFSVYLHMDTDGYPHISFYPTGGGSSFAGIYFGTGSSLMQHHTKVTDTVTH
jgi:hypothetical protein